MTRLSILGLNELTNGSVWDRLIVPDGIDRDNLINNILMECAELGLVYTDPDTMKNMIGIWSRKEQINWIQLKKALESEYDPLHNYDRHEEWRDTGSSQVAGFNQDAGMADRDAAQSDHTGHIFGNIGVTMATQMALSETAMRIQTNLLDAITQSFKNQFCVQVY